MTLELKGKEHQGIGLQVLERFSFLPSMLLLIPLSSAITTKQENEDKVGQRREKERRWGARKRKRERERASSADSGKYDLRHRTF